MSSMSWISSWWYGQSPTPGSSSSNNNNSSSNNHHTPSSGATTTTTTGSSASSTLETTQIPRQQRQQQQQQQQQPDLMFKSIVIGDGRVGKTSLLARYADHSFNNFCLSTNGVDFKRKVLTRRGFTINLEIWDTAGQEHFRSITRSYYRGAAGIVLAFDLSNKATLDSIFDRWIPSIEDTLSSSELVNASFVVVGTKADLPRQLPPTDQLAHIIRTKLMQTILGRQIHSGDSEEEEDDDDDDDNDNDDDEEEEFERTYREVESDIDIVYLETSAKDNIRVDECFESLVDSILDRRESIRRQIEFSETSPSSEERSFMIGASRAVNTGVWSYVSGWC